MTFLQRLMPADGDVLEWTLFMRREEQLDVVAQRALITLQSEHVIGVILDDLSRDLLLASHRVDGHRRTFQRQQLQEIGDRCDLVRLLRDFDLSEHETLSRTPRRDQIDRRLGAAFLVGAPECFTVDGDEIRSEFRQRCDPGNEATLEGLRVEGCEQIAELIMRRRAVLKGAEPAQKIELLLAERGDLDPAVCPRQHRQQALQQHLIHMGERASLIVFTNSWTWRASTPRRSV